MWICNGSLFQIWHLNVQLHMSILNRNWIFFAWIQSSTGNANEPLHKFNCFYRWNWIQTKTASLDHTFLFFQLVKNFWLNTFNVLCKDLKYKIAKYQRHLNQQNCFSSSSTAKIYYHCENINCNTNKLTELRAHLMTTEHISYKL